MPSMLLPLTWEEPSGCLVLCSNGKPVFNEDKALFCAASVRLPSAKGITAQHPLPNSHPVANGVVVNCKNILFSASNSVDEAAIESVSHRPQ